MMLPGLKLVRISLLIVMILCMAMASCSPLNKTKAPAFTEEQQVLIEAASVAVRQHGDDLKKFRVIYDEGNAIWKSDIKNIPVPELDGHDYQLIIYAPRDRRQLGGILYVLVDRNTREVLRIIPRQ